MPQERLAAERQPLVAAWPPAYEHSPWLDVHNRAIQVEGDPATTEEFAAADDFLQVVTVYFQTDWGSSSSATQRGLWWMVRADDIKAELDHRNQWATWEALHQREPD